jgi:hypothetical protein
VGFWTNFDDIAYKPIVPFSHKLEMPHVLSPIHGVSDATRLDAEDLEMRSVFKPIWEIALSQLTAPLAAGQWVHKCRHDTRDGGSECK